MQANFIFEKTQKLITNHIPKIYLKNNQLREDYTWEGILSATDFLVQSTLHTTLQAISVQLMFWCDMILNTPFVSDL